MNLNRNASLNVLRDITDSLQIRIRATKQEKGHWWEKAIPGTEDGKTAFEWYCMAKRDLRWMRKELATVNAMIRFIKKNVK